MDDLQDELMNEIQDELQESGTINTNTRARNKVPFKIPSICLMCIGTSVIFFVIVPIAIYIVNLKQDNTNETIPIHT